MPLFKRLSAEAFYVLTPMVTFGTILVQRARVWISQLAKPAKKSFKFLLILSIAFSGMPLTVSKQAMALARVTN